MLPPGIPGIGFPYKNLANFVKPFGQLWLTYKNIYIYMSEELYVINFLLSTDNRYVGVDNTINFEIRMTASDVHRF